MYNNCIKKVLHIFILTAFLVSFVFNDCLLYADLNGNTINNIEAVNDISLFGGGEIYGKDVLVIYISDLHNNFSAQEKIVKIIDAYDKKNKLKGIFAEGAPAGKVETSLFEGLDENLKKSILDKMLKNGRIGACEYYASYYQKDILYGIEDAKIYAENLALIRRMLEIYDENAEVFGSLDRKNANLKKRRLSAVMYKIEKALEEENEKSYSKIKDFFQQDKNFDALQYKDFLNYLKIKEENAGINLKEVQTDFSKLHKYAASKLSYRDYSDISSFALNGAAESDSLGCLLEKVYKIISQKMPETKELFPQAYKAVETFYLKDKLNFYEIYAQKEKLRKYTINNYASEEEKEIFFITDAFDALKRIYLLDVSREEFNDFIKNREKFKNAAVKYADVAEYNVLSNLADNGVTDLIYENNIKRDCVFFESVKKVIDLQKNPSLKVSEEENLKIENFESVYIVVAGGFHKEFCGFLKDNGVSYINLMPKLKDTPSQKEKYFDAIRLPGKLGVKSLYYSNSAFAPPLLNILNSKADDDMKDVMLKNIISAWLESAKEYSQRESETFEDIRLWLNANGISGERIEKYPSLKRISASDKNISPVLDPALQKPQETSAANSGELAAASVLQADKDAALGETESKKESVFSKIKKFFEFKGRWSFPAVAASFAYIKKASSHAEFIEVVKEAQKGGADAFELILKKRAEGDFYFEINNGVSITLKEALSVIDNASKKKKKNNIIIKFDASVGDGIYEIFSFIGDSGNAFAVVSADREFIRACSGIYKNVNFVYEFHGDSPEDILSLADLNADGVYTDAKTFKKNGGY
ncbi:MAG: hypothetical protein LBO62_02625, partial [Endomicrobium sp.]|nr:hypothetical protein [Endomicrobium sp.]